MLARHEEIADAGGPSNATGRGMAKTSIVLPRLGFGTTALGDMPRTYGYSVDEAEARETLRAILSGPPVLIDSSRNYGSGRSEERLGRALAEAGGLPQGFVLSTKLDRDMETGGFDADQARRSMEGSLRALGVERFDLLHLHDPEYVSRLDEVTRRGGALDALFRMKKEGWAGAVGLAAGKVETMRPLLQRWDFDALITHNRFTLVNRNAEAMIDEAVARGIAVINAAPYASGLLVRGSASGAPFVYQEPDPATLEQVRRIEETCARHGVAPGAVALQFSLRDPRIATTLCGVGRSQQVAMTHDWAAMRLPEGLWEELAALPVERGDPEAKRRYLPD